MKLYRDMTDEEKAKANKKHAKKLELDAKWAKYTMDWYDTLPKELRDLRKYAVGGL